MKRLTLVLGLIFFAYLAISCSENEFSKEETHDLENTEVIDKLLGMGYDVEDIEDLGDKYLVEDDMLFSKDLKDYNIQKSTNAQKSSNGKEMPDGININQFYFFEYFLNTENYCINVYSELSGVPVLGQTSDWSTAVDDALDLWSQATCIELNRVDDASQADMRIITDNDIDGVGYGYAPNNGEPGDVLINKNFPYNSADERVAGLCHEIGHALGFKHVATNSLDPNFTTIPGLVAVESIMQAGNQNFLEEDGPSTSDIAALNYFYDDCDPNGPCDSNNDDPNDDDPIGNISGPEVVCAESSVTYNWVGEPFFVDSWNVSSNLNVISEDSNTITVDIQGGQDATIDAIIDNNVADTFIIELNNGPSPNSNFTGINGPSDLYRGSANARYYYVSSSTLSGVSDINWTVFSYDYPNASQYFSIVSPSSGNSEYNATISAASNTPLGQYVIQFQSSNACGNYYIDKTIEVIGGPPVIIGN